MEKYSYMTFDEVLLELKISEEKLQQLVSEAKIRAFRIQNSLQFRRGDVIALKRQIAGKKNRT